MLEDKPFNQVVAARLHDFFQPGARWFRGLWDVGTVLSLREVLEASEAWEQGVLSEATLKWLCADVNAALMADAGVPKSTREHFKRVLAAPPRFRSSDWFSLRDLTTEVQDEYLVRWAEAIGAMDEPSSGATAVTPLKAERTARVIAAHLLDIGFSQPYLAGWLTQELGSPTERSLSDLVKEVDRVARIRALAYTVLVPVSTGLTPLEAPSDWVSGPQVKALLSSVPFAKTRLRYAGGWLLRVEHRDPYSAAHAAFDEVDRRAARLLVGRGQRMAPVGEAYVFGEPVPVGVQRASTISRVRVRSIELQKQLFQQTPTSQVDAAFELLAQIDGSSAFAVAGGWAAIEALLAGKEDKVTAAQRLASLVAASFPRAELTSLAAQQMRARSSLGQRLRDLPSNRERADLMASELLSASPPEFEHWTDRAAVNRVVQMLKSPREKLADVLCHIDRAFRRYYRHRNLVLHWGRTSPVALRACLRTTTPLLAAGIDRVAHAWFVRRVSPIELATLAKSRLDLADRPGRRLAELLEGIGCWRSRGSA